MAATRKSPGPLAPTGRELHDSTGSLIEAQDARGDFYLTLAPGPAFQQGRAAASLSTALDLVEGFLMAPLVVGVVEVAHRDGLRLTYPTGKVWTVGEALRLVRERGDVPGERAALEIAILGAEILAEASQSGSTQGCFSHGALTPWRLALKADGQLLVLGYGVPGVDWLQHLLDPSFPLDPEGVRYMPPERLERLPEDAPADLYSLTAIAYEVATGEPLMPGLSATALQQDIRMTVAARRLVAGETPLRRPLARAFARQLIFDPDTRPDAAEWTKELRDLLPSATGPSLATWMEQVVTFARERAARTRTLREPGQAPVAAPSGPASRPLTPAEGAPEAPLVAEGRWGRVTRGRTDEPVPPEAPPEVPVAAPPPTAGASERRLRRLDPPVPSAAAAPPPTAPPLPEAAPRRLRRLGDPEPAPPVSPPPPAPEPPPPPSAQPPAPEPPPAEPPRRRLRRSDGQA